MNQDKIQYILIGILMAGMFAIGLGVYVMNQQIQMISESIRTIEQGMGDAKTAPASAPQAAIQAQPSTRAYTFGLLNLEHPAGWYVETYEDEFRSGQTDLVLTSSQGRLLNAESSGGPGMPGVKYFQTGYQINIVPVTLGEPEDYVGTKVEGYSNLYMPLEPCDGAGCPTVRYYLYLATKGLFEINVVHAGVSAQDAKEIVDVFLKSLN